MEVHVRPLKLQVKGFTAFRDRQELDFRELDVFAIAGSTGSGKSSLLDAMTYALYGRVERVGDRVSQLVSQGQARMAVTLEFEVGNERYRVTRSTPSGRGATKIQLERHGPGGEWRQAGEGSDRVREAEQIITRAIGLTYDGFTRSVLLPQGKFAEFLVGDAKKRRDILTELLGLSLFRRMAERAGALAREASVRAQTMAQLLGSEYADASPEALKEARAAARAAEKREKALAGVAERIVAILARWQESKRSAEELRACADEAARAAHRTSAAAAELAELAGSLRDTAVAVEESAAASTAAGRALEEAVGALQEAEASLGSARDLAGAQSHAQSLADATRARDVKVAESTRSVDAAGSLAEAVASAERALAERTDVLAVRETDANTAEAALEAARHQDLVATVSAGLKIGDPCPVCGEPLRKVPKETGADGLDKATEALQGARKDLEATRKAVVQSDREADTARRDVQSNQAEQERLAAELGEAAAHIASHQEALGAILGLPLPGDPAGTIENRLRELHQLDRAERDATRAAAEAAEALLKAEQERDRVVARVDRQHDLLAADHQPLFDRAARAIGKKASPIKLPAPPVAADPVDLTSYAEKLAGALATFAERLARDVEERSSTEDRFLEEANEAVGGLLEEPSATLQELAEAVNAACRKATADVATAKQRAEQMTTRLQRKGKLAEEMGAVEARSRVFRVLALELRADHLIAFLQAEALQVLATAGSERLASLSDGRYRIVCRDDEFFVIDTWNGDEERSVRTLSGGETFLASLALALALADQVRSLSVTNGARLDSLFLDEGFGTLDQETLRVVVDAIEQLAGDGRLIGVITHVRDLAEQFPRVEVRKSHRGSSLELVS